MAQPDAPAGLPSQSHQPGGLNGRGLRNGSPRGVSDPLVSDSTLIFWTDQGAQLRRELERFEGVALSDQACRSRWP